MLQLHILPPSGGDTMFSNMYAAYESLSPAVRDMLDGLTATHESEHIYRGRYSDRGRDDSEIDCPSSVHPIVRTHPATGARVVYVNGAFTSHIKDMEAEESALLLDELFKSAWNPEIQCRFKWRTGSIAFWDNRARQHFAASDYFPAVRAMERVTIAGDRPYFDSVD